MVRLAILLLVALLGVAGTGAVKSGLRSKESSPVGAGLQSIDSTEDGTMSKAFHASGNDGSISTNQLVGSGNAQVEDQNPAVQLNGVEPTQQGLAGFGISDLDPSNTDGTFSHAYVNLEGASDENKGTLVGQGNSD